MAKKRRGGTNVGKDRPSRRPTSSTKSKGQKTKSTKSIKSQRRACFVISPIGDIGTEIHHHANQVIEEIAKPALEPLGYRVYRIDTDTAPAPGFLLRDILVQLCEAPLVVAILTDQNPNVMYELAIRHILGGLGLPVVQLARSGEELPFDISGWHTIFYSLERQDGVRKATSKLKSIVSSILKTPGGNPGVFEPLMAILKERFSLDGVFAAKLKTLTVLHDRLLFLKQEILADFEQGEPNARPLAQFALWIKPEFERLRIQVDVFETIAREQNEHLPRKRCERVLEGMKDLQDKGVGLRDYLDSAGSSEVEFRRAGKHIDQLVADVEKVRKECNDCIQ